MKNNFKTIKDEFPFFKNNNNVIYFDSALTTQKPKSVIDNLKDYYENMNYSTFRSNNAMAYKLKEKFEKAIIDLANFLNVNVEELIFVSGATDGLNGLARSLIKKMDINDEIILGEFEHASNFLPWKEYGKEKNIKFKYYDVNDKFVIDIEKLKKLITKKTKVISFAHVYNTLGSTNDVKKIVSEIKKINKDCIVVVDGAQAVGHVPVDLKDYGVDAYVFSGHKMFAANGIGVVYVKKELMDTIDPFNYGGGNNIDFDKDEIIYKNAPLNFYSGTLNYPSILSFTPAIEFINKCGIHNIDEYCNELKQYAEEKLSKLENVRVINKKIKSSILLFEILNGSSEDAAYSMGEKNFLLRSGASCVKVKNNLFDANKLLRLSFHVYNNKSDIDRFVEEFKKGKDFVGIIFDEKYTKRLCV